MKGYVKTKLDGSSCNNNLHWERARAGLQSMIERAYLPVGIIRIDPARQCCPGYVDTDRNIFIRAGDDNKYDERPSSLGDRRSGLKGHFVLHRTCGGRPEWRLADDCLIFVRGRSGIWNSGTVESILSDPDACGIRDLLGRLALRLAVEIAAQYVEKG